jgi:hypothetical protein
MDPDNQHNVKEMADEPEVFPSGIPWRTAKLERCGVYLFP